MKKELLTKLVSIGAIITTCTFGGMSAFASDSEPLFYEDYDGDTVIQQRSGTGEIITDEETGNKYIKMNRGWSDAQFAYTLPSITSGKLKIEFDYMKDEETLNKQSYIALADANLYRPAEYLRLLSTNNYGTSQNKITAFVAQLICKESITKADKWYTFRYIIDMDTHDVSVTMYEKGNETPMGTLSFENLERTADQCSGWPETKNEFIRFVHYGDADAYMDNISIKYTYDEPELSSENITIMNQKGDIQKNKQEVIASANVIKIEFEADMDESTLNEDTLYVTKKDETEKIPMSLSVEKSGRKATVTLLGEEKWVPGEYTIHVSDAVSNMNGDTLGEEYTEDFTVIPGKVAKVSFLYKDSECDLTEDEKVKPEVEKIVFALSGEVDKDALSDISVKNEDVEVLGERIFNESDNTYTIVLDEYLKQNSRYSLYVPYAVVSNVYENSFETDEGIYEIESAEFLDEDLNPTEDMSEIRSLKIKIINTKEISKSYRVFVTTFNDESMKNMLYYDFDVEKSQSGKEILMPVTIDKNAESIEKLIWEKPASISEDNEKELKSCEFSEDGKVVVSGAFNADAAGKLLKITVFKPGKSAEDLKELSENNQNVLYFGTISADSKGKYSFEFKKSEESGFYDIEIETEDGVKEVFTIFNNDKEISKDIVYRLNGATSNDEFYRLLYGTDENFRELGFYMNDSESVGLENISGLLYEYVKNTAEFSEDDNIERIKVFRKMYAITLLNEEKKCEDFEELLGVSEEAFYEYFAKEYITDSVKDDIFEALSGCDFESVEEYQDEFLKEVILKTVRYSDGYGNIRDILTEYKDETGIKVSDLGSSNYNNVIGKKYDDYDELETALKSEKTSNTSSGGSSGGGGGSKKPNVSMTVDSSLIAKPGATAVEKEAFSDISGYVWAKDAIEGLYKNGIVTGKAENLFYPADNVTREEFVVMLIRAKGTDYKTSDVKFTDVTPGAWYEKYISAAVADGIVNGKDDGSFGIGEKISRQDMAVMLYRALNLEGSSDVVEFSDDSEISGYAKAPVYTMRNMNIITGLPDGSFKPLDNATRAEAAVILFRGFYETK